jgi:hypothetical protein
MTKTDRPAPRDLNFNIRHIRKEIILYCHDLAITLGLKLWELGNELIARRGSESPPEVKLARPLEQIVLRTGGAGL